MRRLLIVAPDWTVLGALARIFSTTEDLAVEVASSARDAKEAFLERRFDAALIDESISACELIALATRRRCTAVALVAEGSSERLLPLLAAGACDFVAKNPVSIARCEAQLEAACERGEDRVPLREAVANYAREARLLLRAKLGAESPACVLFTERQRARDRLRAEVDTTAALAMDLADLRELLCLELTIEAGLSLVV